MNTIYTVEEMKKYIDEYGISYGEISKKSNVPISTVQKIFGGLVKKPRKSTLELLSKFFIYYDWKSIGKLDSGDGLYSLNQLETIGMVAEKHQLDILQKINESNSPHNNTNGNNYNNDNIYINGSSAPKINNNSSDSSNDIFSQKKYTYNDYAKLELPKGVRVEVMDGRLIRMDSPSIRHQLIAGELYRLISNYIRSNHGKCVPFVSPIDARLEYRADGSDKTILEPDVSIICDKDKLTGMKTINGAPDFIAEITSPSTKKYDMYDKMNKYRITGVREYWVLDYDSDKIIKYNFEKDGELSMYSFSDKVSVDIYEDNEHPLIIDFAEIKEYIESMT